MKANKRAFKTSHITLRNAAAVQEPPPGLPEMLLRSANRLSEIKV